MLENRDINLESLTLIQLVHLYNIHNVLKNTIYWETNQLSYQKYTACEKTNLEEKFVLLYKN